MNLYQWLNQRHSDKIWASIGRQMKGIDEGTVKTYSWEDMESRREAREKAPLYKKLYRNVYYFLFGMEGLLSYTLNPRHVVNRVVWDRQRAKRGWCDSDCWSIDHHITRVLSGMLMHLSEHNVAYPGRPPFDTPELWHAHLVDLAARMRAWSEDDTPENYLVTQRAMEEFTANLGWYWD